jgi:PAS domain S-box-containing protein
MNFLDIRTIMFSQLITDAVCTAVLIFLWLENRKRYAGMFFWVLDLVFQTLAILLIILRGSLPAWISMGLANTLVIAGALFGYWGLERFVGKRSSQVHNYFLLVIFFLIHLYFIFFQPSLEARNLNVSLGLLLVCFQCAWLLLRRAGGTLVRITKAVGLVFILFCLVSLTRVFILVFMPPPVDDFFKSGLYDALILITFQVLLILLTFGMAAMVNLRLLVEVKTQEEKFTKAFHSSPYAISISRASDGQILDVNEGFLSITGYTYPEVVGKTTLDLKLWEHELDRATIVSELSGVGRVRERELKFRNKLGDSITGLFSADTIMIDDQLWLVSSINDISERKREEEEIRQLNSELEKRVVERTRELRETQDQLVLKEKLAILGQMAGSVGHELRNPLAVISNSVYYLKMAQPEAKEKIKEYLDIIENETRTSDKIISDLLNFARVISVERELVSIPDLVQRVLNRFPPPKDVSVALDFPKDLSNVFVDPHQLEQVLGNLVLNACQAMPDGGHLSITAHLSKRQVGIAVKDTGTGITHENMKKLFEPLFTTKTKGLGLGLAVSQKLAEANDGRIDVESEPSQGSTFTIWLPVNQE